MIYAKNKMYNNMIRKFFKWIFKDELNTLYLEIKKSKNIVNDLSEQKKMFDKVFSNIDVTIDVHEYKHSPSWAVISLQGQKCDYIKFMDLGESDIREIQKFLRSFERSCKIKIDASPHASQILRIERR